MHQFHFYISFCRKAIFVHRSVCECHIYVSMISQFYCGFLFFLFFFNHILQRSFIHILPHLGVIFKKHHIANENVAFLYTRLTKIRQSINNYHINNYHIVISYKVHFPLFFFKLNRRHQFFSNFNRKLCLHPSSIMIFTL